MNPNIGQAPQSHNARTLADAVRSPGIIAGRGRSWYTNALVVVIALLLYIFVGPLAWIGLSLAARSGVIRMRRLHVEHEPLSEPAPTLSIVVPARDEAAGIGECVSRILAQDYPNAGLVVVDDRSIDGTSAILDAIAAREPRLRVVHVKSIDEGWLGKCHALFVGTQNLESEWLLFIDSDVCLTPDAARRAVALADHRRYDALSVMPRLDARSFWERALLPMLAMAWGAAFQISLTNDDSRPNHALANGQFFLIRRSIYESVGGHAAVKDRIVEDVALMRILKKSGARTRLMMGQQLAATRMHTNLRQMFHGWARIFAGSSGRSTLPMLMAILFLLTTVVTFLAALGVAIATGNPHWIAACSVHAVFVAGFMAWTYVAAGQKVRYALLLPLTWPMVVAILSYAVHVCASGRVDWRGSAVTVNRD